MSNQMRAQPYYASTAFLDHTSPEVRGFVDQTLTTEMTSPRSQALALYYAVRDRINYEVYRADLSRTGLRASSVVRNGVGMCLHKSTLFAATLRSIGIPSRLVLVDVRNHLASDRLKRLMGGDVFHFHCMTSLRLDDRWVKATPVFNGRLCRLYGIAPLEFDGFSDSVHHPFDLQGQRHMEVLRTHGEFDDLPYELITAGLSRTAGTLFGRSGLTNEGSLVDEAPGPLRDGKAGVPEDLRHH